MKTTIFAFHDSSPKYKQIYEKFKGYIENGDLPLNEQLPSIRQLADSLSVSRNTTLNAYEQLVAEGYIRSEGRTGYFVNNVEPPLFPEVAVASGTTKSAAGEEEPIIVDFRAGAVDQQHFPLKVWRRMVHEALSKKESFQYGNPLGEECLREQIATYLFQSRGVRTDPSAVIIGSGTQQLLVNLGMLLKEEFPSIIVEDPGYDGAREAFHLHGFTLETLPVFETGAHFAGLDVTPSHQSPVGVSMSIQERVQLIHWAKSRQGYILEDDYDSEFRYTQQPFPALASIDSTRVMYVGNFSKSFLPGIRLSYMVLPEPLLSRYVQRFLPFECTASLQNQLAMAAFIKTGEWNRHIKRMRLVYKRKMQCLVSELRKHFNESIHIVGEQSGLFVLAQLQLNRPEEWLMEQASIHGVKVYPTSIYSIQNHVQPTVKLGFSNISCEEIEVGVGLLKKAWL
ncbi:PLP-dependent aminotransferase family protein [Bacillus sp. RO3]|nr:PLP-dependent aminotransferase family protein [Bacillus sp. RO3]